MLTEGGDDVNTCGAAATIFTTSTRRGSEASRGGWRRCGCWTVAPGTRCNKD